eukprot:TRINITY_DN18168_c0_g2_i1.p1 TRINITY_DN18168_c0_g2~~TRINITY_DN18168_c0_g2_i1.p1  ORF type:complete len:145 (+),score=24.25 TRINITY_DN18168_c0_g2_i1:52-486(+)
MDERADDAGEQSRLHYLSTRSDDVKSLRVQSIVTQEPYMARGSLADEGTSLLVENRGNASFTSAEHHVHRLNSESSSAELQMYGSSCFVRKLKPARLGCAIVEFISSSVREEVMVRAQQFTSVNGVPIMEIRGVSVNLRRHVDN